MGGGLGATSLCVMKKYKLLISVLLFISSAFIVQAQDWKGLYQKIDSTYTLFSSNNKHKLSISIMDDDTADFREFYISVYNLSGETIQKFSDINYAAENKGDFRLRDINFDNYDDLIVLVNENPFNRCYEFWRFDTLLQKYEFDSLFSEIITCNPDFNKDSKTIYTSSADGRMMTFWDQTYNYNNGKLLLIKEELQEQYELIDSLNYQYNYRRIKKVRQGDEMIIVKEVIGTLEELDEKWDK
jgi:hypothetical protein